MNSNLKRMVKVDSIRSAEDVVFFREIGVNYLGIPVVGISDLERTRSVVSDDFSDVCYRFDLREISEDECVKFCQFQEPLAVDFVGHFLPNRSTCEAVLSKQSQVFFSNIEASYDTDPSWILSRHHELLDLENTFFQIDLLEQTEDAWRILRDVVSEDRDELTIADIDEMTKQHDTFLNLNFTPSNFFEILESFPSVRGVTFSLEQCNFRRWYTKQQIRAVLQSRPFNVTRNDGSRYD